MHLLRKNVPIVFLYDDGIFWKCWYCDTQHRQNIVEKIDRQIGEQDERDEDSGKISGGIVFKRNFFEAD